MPLEEFMDTSDTAQNTIPSTYSKKKRFMKTLRCSDISSRDCTSSKSTRRMLPSLPPPPPPMGVPTISLLDEINTSNLMELCATEDEAESPRIGKRLGTPVANNRLISSSLSNHTKSPLFKHNYSTNSRIVQPCKYANQHECNYANEDKYMCDEPFYENNNSDFAYDINEELVLKAIPDPVLLNDSRVLSNLLKVEDKYLVNPNYFTRVQTDVQPWMRDSVAHWMLEVCEEQRCESEVFPLSMNLMDRFLSIVNLQRSNLQLLGAVCMFVASKLKETIPLSAEKLVIYTDHSIRLPDLLHWEMVLIQKLRWDLAAVTPHDFLQQLLSRLPLHCHEYQLVLSHAQTFISLCYVTDVKFSMHPPSMIAAGSVCAAINGLLPDHRRTKVNVFKRLQKITSIDTDCLHQCQEQLEKVISQNLPPDELLNFHPQSCSSSNTNTNGQTSPKTLASLDSVPNQHPLPTTPTDVRDIQLI